MKLHKEINLSAGWNYRIFEHIRADIDQLLYINNIDGKSKIKLIEHSDITHILLKMLRHNENRA